MKVILLQEIKGQGGEGDVVEVKRGYAVNYLFPQKMAIEATKGNLKQLELRKHNIAQRESERIDTADKLKAALTDKTLTIEARVGEEGQLFGSVTTQQIAEKLKETLNIEVDRKKIDLHAAIKTAGEHSVTVSIYRDIKAVLTVNVVDENAEEAPDAAAVVAEADAAAKEIANELAEAADAEPESDASAEELADAAVEVLTEAESVIDAAAEEAVEEAVENQE